MDTLKLSRAKSLSDKIDFIEKEIRQGEVAIEKGYSVQSKYGYFTLFVGDDAKLFIEFAIMKKKREILEPLKAEFAAL